MGLFPKFNQDIIVICVRFYFLLIEAVLPVEKLVDRVCISSFAAEETRGDAWTGIDKYQSSSMIGLDLLI